jgi:hypothetical protein
LRISRKSFSRDPRSKYLLDLPGTRMLIPGAIIARCSPTIFKKHQALTGWPLAH